MRDINERVEQITTVLKTMPHIKYDVWHVEEYFTGKPMRKINIEMKHGPRLAILVILPNGEVDIDKEINKITLTYMVDTYLRCDRRRSREAIVEIVGKCEETLKELQLLKGINDIDAIDVEYEVV